MHIDLIKYFRTGGGGGNGLLFNKVPMAQQVHNRTATFVKGGTMVSIQIRKKDHCGGMMNAWVWVYRGRRIALCFKGLSYFFVKRAEYVTKKTW